MLHVTLHVGDNVPGQRRCRQTCHVTILKSLHDLCQTLEGMKQPITVLILQCGYINMYKLEILISLDNGGTFKYHSNSKKISFMLSMHQASQRYCIDQPIDINILSKYLRNKC